MSDITSPSLSYPGYAGVTLTEPRSLGGYQSPRRPEEPTVVEMRGGIARLPGKAPRDRFRAARGVLYETTFEEFERRIRTDLLRLPPAFAVRTIASVSGDDERVATRSW